MTSHNSVGLALLALIGLGGCGAPEAPLPTTPIRASVVTAPQEERYIVVYKASVSDTRAEISRDVTPGAARVERIYQYALRGWSGTLTPGEYERLKHEPHVQFIEPDAIYTINTSQTPTPSWGLDRIDQHALPVNQTYTFSQTGAGVHFYGIDTGILYSHNDFGGRASPGFDAITSGGGAVDCNGHGTHTASTAAGTTYGVAKGMTIVGVRVLDCSGSGAISQVVAGVDWVTAHAIKPAVANMSLGGGLSASLDQAVTNSINSGITYTISSGNSNADACAFSPADVGPAITVNASDINDARASFSNYGTCTDLFAPGVGITAAWNTSNSATAVLSGTSMAAPHVAGVVGLFLESNPSATPAQVATALASNATLNTVSSAGTGSPNRLLYMGFLTSAPTNQPPVARFTWNCVGYNTNQCALDATSSTDDNGIVLYSWNWGNGRSESKTIPTAKNTWLAAGTYNVTLTVTDAGGLTSSQTQAVVVGTPPVNQAPSAFITSPANGGSFVQGSTVTFTGSGTDPEDGALTGASLVWTSNIDGQIGTGTSFTRNNLSLGTHTITLTARDAQNLPGTATRTITITAPVNQAPSAFITSPANGGSFVQGSTVTFTGSGSDPEDGALTGASLVWTSSIDGQIGTGTSFTRNNLSLGTHTITLTARDAQNLPGTATRTITITAPANQPPVASFTWTCTGLNLHQCAFDASGSSDDVGIVLYSWNWGNGRGEAHPWATVKNTWSTAPGTFNVTLTVTDGAGLTSSITKAVIVP